MGGLLPTCRLALAALSLAASPSILGQTQPSIEQYLAAHESRDPIVVRAVSIVRAALPGILQPAWTNLRGVQLFVTDFEDLPLRFYPYRTGSCQATHSPGGVPLILCNEAYLLEAEIPIRAFEDAGQLLLREDALVDFVRRARTDASLMRSRMRLDKRLAARSDQSPAHIALHLAMATLFFASHEIGHLQAGDDFSSYTAPAAPSADANVREAVLRTCRHVDEFNRYGFGLRGLQPLVEVGEDARNIEAGYRKDFADAYQATVKRFGQEEAADKVAARAILSHLRAVGNVDPEQAIEQQHLLMETLFVLGIFRWYSDLSAFAGDTCGRFGNSSELAGCMMQDRQRYVAAGKTFGEVHRFILLRTVLAMNAVVRERTAYHTGEPAERSIWPDRKTLEAGGLTGLHERWRSGDLQRFWLLRILMDTAVKFSYTACFTGWFLELDKRRGRPQPFVMNFEPLEMALERLKRIP